MSCKKIKIAQIGAGHDHANAAFQNLKMLNDIYDFVGFTVVPEDALNLPGFSYEGQKEIYQGVPKLSLEEVLDYPGLEAVCIETEDRALTKYALMAAERELHVYMDKPGGVSDEEYDRLIDMVKEKGLVFQAGYMYRFNPAVLQLKKDIADGKLGELISVEAQMNCLHGLEKRNWLGDYPGGMLYWLGCHLIDLIYDLMGEPEEIIPLSMCSGKDGTTAEDFGMVAFRYKKGVSFAKTSAVEYGGFERRQLVVSGTKGTVELKPFEWLCPPAKEILQPQITGVREAYSENWHEKAPYYETPVSGRYDAMLRGFAGYINGVQKNPFDYEYERGLHKLILKACGKAL